jgi:segregation and condensation protein B
MSEPEQPEQPEPDAPGPEPASEDTHDPGPERELQAPELQEPEVQEPELQEPGLEESQAPRAQPEDPEAAVEDADSQEPDAADSEQGDVESRDSEVPPADLGEPEATTPPPDQALQPAAEVTAVVEALIFASPEPITPRLLFRLLAEEPKEDVTAAIAAVKADYDNRPGLQFVEVAGGYQIVTRPELHEWVRRLFHERSSQKLTIQGLETLAVIAYKQPITALEIAEIRGVNTSGVLSTLLERHLIKIVGRKNIVGRPFLYATTREFLVRFGLKDLTDLPKIEDMSEALGFDPPAGLIEQSPREDVLPLDDDPEQEAAAEADAKRDAEPDPDPDLDPDLERDRDPDPAAG